MARAPMNTELTATAFTVNGRIHLWVVRTRQLASAVTKLSPNNDVSGYKYQRDQLEKTMTKEQITQAQRLATRCQIQKFQNCDQYCLLGMAEAPWE